MNIAVENMNIEDLRHKAQQKSDREKSGVCQSK
jgi:hypothetical protein